MKTIRKISFTLLFLVLLFSLWYGSITLASAKQAMMIWLENLVPSLFFGMVIVFLLDRYGYLIWLSKIVFCWGKKLFCMDEGAFSLVLAGCFLGLPSGSLLIDRYVEEGFLSEAGGKRLMLCMALSTPSYIILTCGGIYLHSVFIGALLYFSQVIACFLLLLCTRTQTVQIQRQPHSNLPPFFHSLKEAVGYAGISLFYIGGYLLLASVLLGLLTSILPINIQQGVKSIGDFALGCYQISLLSTGIKQKGILLSALLGFAGFSVHLQIFSLTRKIQVPYGQFFCYRLIQAALSALIFYILF